MNAVVRGMRRCVLGIVPIRCAAADEKTDAAATILRMLYIRDLRGLQTLIDETLVNVQVSCAFDFVAKHVSSFSSLTLSCVLS